MRSKAHRFQFECYGICVNNIDMCHDIGDHAQLIIVKIITGRRALIDLIQFCCHTLRPLRCIM